MKDKDSVFSLFISFVKIGTLTFGGGMAMLPMLEKECVDKNHWVSKEELLDIFAIGQCTPGIIAVNTATYIGYKKKKFFGSLFATLGIALPSLVIIITMAGILSSVSSNIYIQKAFSGIRIAVCALISGSVIKLAANAVNDVEKVIIAVLALGIQIAFGLSPAILVLSLILWSAILFFLKRSGK